VRQIYTSSRNRVTQLKAEGKHDPAAKPVALPRLHAA
jgi:hypothetical protein